MKPVLELMGAAFETCTTMAEVVPRLIGTTLEAQIPVAELRPCE